LPLFVLHSVARFWGTALYLLPGRAKDTTIKNLRSCFPEKDRDEINRLARRSLQNTACTALELGKAWMLPVEKTLAMVTHTSGLDEFKQALESGDGVILIAPHLSNWEIFGQYVSDLSPTTFMYQPPKMAAVDKLLKETRSRNGIKLAPTNRKGVSLLLSSLSEGELVGVLPDQVPTDEGGLFAPFFGVPALTMTLVSKIVQRKKAKVFCGYAERLPKAQGFKVVLKEADQGIYSQDLQESVTALNRTVEASIAATISQYQWEYKRFRRSPDGKKFY